MRERILLQGGNRILTPVAIGIGALGSLGAVFADPLLGRETAFGLDQFLVLAFGIGFVGLGLLPAPAAPKLLALPSAVATLLLCELLLRLVSGGELSTIYRLDERYLHANVAGTSKTFVRRAANGGDQILISINSGGFRGDELLPPGTARRIVVYGDSSIAAEFSGLEHTFPRRLQAALEAARGETVEVVNAGVVAYGPDQVALRMEDELGTLEPELVIVAIFVHNDFGDLVRNKLYRIGERGELRRNAITVGSSLRLQDAYRKARELSTNYGMLQAPGPGFDRPSRTRVRVRVSPAAPRRAWRQRGGNTSTTRRATWSRSSSRTPTTTTSASSPEASRHGGRRL